ncbi:uncharacterized protein LOC128998330 [Macrosteles quadrilineatus]|uniref:uncharacterized protein LOC128998330 n=1 Tax=Macrosteles quadrilineatus TaxID=74068 RepID=UPI0023E2E5EB|nr:uncharacterized protein LOC128998330 [Macrosteles quadrilineatus]
MSGNPGEASNRPNNFSLVPVENSNLSSDNPNSQTQLPSISNPTTEPTVQDMRQPHTLQDLLKISTRLQGNDRPPEQISQEKAEFLKNALNAMTVDLVPEMQKRLEVLKEVQTKPENFVDTNLAKYQETLEQLVEFLYEIDLAQIFYQIDGLNIIAPLLKSKHASLRSSTAAIILECCKNNPFCQELSVTDEVFRPLMEMASSDPNKDAMFKAIAAVSAIARSNPAGISQFNKYNGIKMVEKALNSGCEKIVNKTIFLIMGLCDTDETVKRNLTESGVIVNLITLLRLSDNIVKEYILRCLLSITRENPAAQQICRQHNLDSYLSTLTEINTDPETQDLVECAVALIKQL